MVTPCALASGQVTKPGAHFLMGFRLDQVGLGYPAKVLTPPVVGPDLALVFFTERSALPELTEVGRFLMIFTCL